MMMYYLIILVVGFVLLYEGADFFVDGSIALAERFGIPHLVIGFTIVGVGTSVPETAVSITAALEQNVNICVGSFSSNLISIRELALFSFVFLLYISLFVVIALRNKAENEDATSISSKSILLLIVFGVIAVNLGSKLTVCGATGLAREYNLNEKFIAMSVMALGITLPVLFTSINAVIKGHYNTAFGNIIGSNVYSVFVTMGAASKYGMSSFQSVFALPHIFSFIFLIVLLSLKYNLGQRKEQKYAGSI